MADKKYIKTLRMSDGSRYYFYDVSAARAAELEDYVSKSGGTMTGDLTVDAMLTANGLTVVAIDEREIAIENVLTQAADGSVQKRSADEVLYDIGGYSVAYGDGVLSFKRGK